MEDMIRIPGWGEECIVCGRGLGGYRVSAQVLWQDETGALCCPACEEAFRQSPAFYIFRRDIVKLLHPGELKPAAA